MASFNLALFELGKGVETGCTETQRCPSILTNHLAYLFVLIVVFFGFSYTNTIAG